MDSQLPNMFSFFQVPFIFKRKTKNPDISQSLLLNVGSHSTKIYKQIQPFTSTRNVKTAQITRRVLVQHPEDSNQKADEILGILLIFVSIYKKISIDR